VLRHDNFTKYVSFKKQPGQTLSHKKARLDWVRAKCGLDFTSVVFSDEKRFCLASDRYLKYWHFKHQSSRRIIERSQGQLANGLMVWLGVAYNRLQRLKILTKGQRVDSLAYQD
jgi:hypothetical protein